MNKKNLLHIIALSTLALITGQISAKERLFLKNNSMWNIKFKFAAPENTRAVEMILNAGTTRNLGSTNEAMLEITNLSIKRAGLGEALSPYVALDVDALRSQSNTINQSPLVNGYERDITWLIESSGTSWQARPVSVQRKIE